MVIKKSFLGFILFFLFTNNVFAFESELEFKRDFDKTELNYFLNVWSDYLVWSKKSNIKEIPRSDLEANVIVYSDEVIKWLEGQGFTVDRFFYLEERVKLAVRACIVKKENSRNSSAVKNRLLDIVDSDAIKETLNQEIEKAKTAHLIFGITEDELAFVCPNLDAVEKIIFAE